MSRNGWVVGIDIGTSRSAGAIGRTASTPGERSVTALEVDGNRWMPSMVLLDPSGTLVVGSAAEHQAALSPDRVERTPKRYLGGATPLLLGGSPVPPVTAISRLIKVFLDEGRLRNRGHPPDQVVLTHPVRWGAERKEALEAAAAEVGSPRPVLTPEPVAAAAHYAMDDTGVGQYVGVYDLGGGTFDTAILRRTDDGFETVGPPGGDEFVGGESFDHLVYEHLGEIIAADDPEVWEQMQYGEERKWTRAAADLLTQARRVKETVSSYPSAQALLPILERETVVTRATIESLIRPHIEQTVDEMTATIRAAGLLPEDLSALYLVGGSSRIPLVSRLLTNAFGDRVTTRDEPKGVVALGAALIAQRRTDPRFRPPSGRFRPLWSQPQGNLVTAIEADDAGVVALSPDRVRRFGLDGGTHWTTGVPSPPTAPAARIPGMIAVGCGSTLLLMLERGGGVHWGAAVRGRIVAPPVLTQSGVIVGDDRGAVTALDGASGQVAWILPIGRPIASPIAVAGSSALIAADHVVYRVDFATGVAAWAFPAPAEVAAVVVTSPVSAAIVCADGQVFMIDGESGAARWGARLAAPPASSVPGVGAPDARPGLAGRVASAVLAPGGRLLVVVDALGRVHGVDLANGERRWVAAAAPVSTPVAPTSVHLAVDGPHALVAMPNGVLAAVNVGDGAVVARAQLHNGPLGALAVTNGRVIVGAADRVLCVVLES